MAPLVDDVFPLSLAE